MEGKIPALLAPLLHGWRTNDRVAALVIETVSASRKAGKPAWPQSIERAVRLHAIDEAEPPSAMMDRTTREPLLDRDRGPSR